MIRSIPPQLQPEDPRPVDFYLELKEREDVRGSAGARTTVAIPSANDGASSTMNVSEVGLAPIRLLGFEGSGPDATGPGKFSSVRFKSSSPKAIESNHRQQNTCTTSSARGKSAGGGSDPNS
jgi:hypothetical protein